MNHPVRGFVVLVLATLFFVACSTTKSRYSMLAGPYPAKPENYEIQVFVKELPQRPFKKISRLDVHSEKTSYSGPSLDAMLPELKKQARLSGADAIIEIRERLSWVIETRVYHVTATGIRFTDNQ